MRVLASISSLVSCFVLLLFPGHALSLTYNIVGYPADQNSHTLSGTITTDGTLGVLVGGNFESYSYTVSGVKGYSDSGTDFEYFEDSVTASATQLIFHSGPMPLATLHSFVLGPSGSDPVPRLQWAGAIDFGGFTDPSSYSSLENQAGSFTWLKFNPTMNGSSDWVIGETASAVIPEPTSAVVWFLLVALVAGRRPQRRTAG